MGCGASSQGGGSNPADGQPPPIIATTDPAETKSPTSGGRSPDATSPEGTPKPFNWVREASSGSGYMRDSLMIPDSPKNNTNSTSRRPSQPPPIVQKDGIAHMDLTQPGTPKGKSRLVELGVAGGQRLSICIPEEQFHHEDTIFSPTHDSPTQERRASFIPMAVQAPAAAKPAGGEETTA